MKKIISKSFSSINNNTISIFNNKSNRFRDNVEITQKIMNVDTKGTASYTIKKMTNEILPNIDTLEIKNNETNTFESFSEYINLYFK